MAEYAMRGADTWYDAGSGTIISRPAHFERK